VQYSCYLPDLEHQFIKLVGKNGLGAVRKRVVWVMMHFHHQPVRAHSHCRERQRQDFVAFSRAMAGVHHDR